MGDQRDETPEEWRERMRSIRFGSRTRDKIVEGKREDGVRIKATTDELNNTVTEHATKEDRVDVLIRAPHVTIKGTQTETRQHA